MREPEIPANEQERLAALRALQLLDTPPEERFDRITRLAQRLFNVPIALVSLVDGHRQWFKSRQGLDATETPRNISFCGHAILNDGVFYVPNAAADARFRDNPLVAGPPDIRFYAGAPLSSPDGHRVGTLCIIDRKPQDLSEEDLRTLCDLGRWVEEELRDLEFRKAADTIRGQEAMMRAILDTVVDGIITIDERGMIARVNPAAVRIFGYAPAEMVGRNVKMLMPEPFHGEHDGYLERYRKTGDARIIGIGREVVGKRKDGGVFPMDLAVSECEVSGRRLFNGIVRDVTAQKAAEEELRATTMLQQAILNSANYSIISTTEDGTIVTFNPAAEAMLGYRAEDVVGKCTPAPFHDAQEVVRRAEELSEELGRRIEPGFEVFVAGARRDVPDEREWTYVRKDGSTLPVLLSVTALRDGARKITGFLGIAYDISERKKIDRMKNEFVSTVSHELRTPLTSIRGSLGLIGGGIAGQLPPQAAELVQIAYKNSERLVRLINDILDIEKIESGKMQFDLRVQPLLLLVQHALEATQGFGAQYGVGIRLASSADDARVRVDGDRLIQIVTNLVSNAVKFSPAGSEVAVSVERRPGGVRVAVADRGPGIPEEFRSRIFEKFSQADSSDTRQKGGTGLGLAITKSLAESMGGRIGFETSGAGTVFWTEWPEIVVLQAPAAAAGAVAGPRILVCEDDPDIANLIKLVVENGGYLADIAYDAQQAKSMLAATAYAAMTLDIGLPGKDGLSLIQELRNQGPAGNLPIVVVSAHLRGNEALQMSGMPVVDWLPKPIDQERLLAAIRRGIGLSPAGRPRVLHVDDDTDVRRVVSALARDVADFDCASDLTTASEMLAKNSYSLVILDLSLPDGCGRDLLPVIAALRPQPRVVVFSANDVTGKEAEAFAACLLKSATSNDKLLAVLKSQIEQSLGA